MIRFLENVDFSNPAAEGLHTTHNFYLSSEPGVSLGVWHVLPQSYRDTAGDDDSWYEEQLADNKTVILYLHGTASHRAGPYRMELYRVLRGMDYHVICFDYRGFGDSSQGVLTETGVVTDARAVYDWLVARTGASKVIVWGHSLGTGVASHLVADLCVEGNRPSGLVLQSPFNNMHDAVRNNPMAWVWSKMPWFDSLFTSSLVQNDLAFVSDKRIAVIDCPILILHADDDDVVPIKLGLALYETALQSRGQGSRAVEFRQFSGELGYGHRFICRAPELPQIVRYNYINFI